MSEKRKRLDELTIRQAQEQVKEYLRGKGEEWTRLSDHHLRVTHLVEEVGELARAVINLDARYHDPHRRGASASQNEKLAELRDSLGDIFYHLSAISIAYGIDLATAFQSSMENIVARYPVSMPQRA